MEAEGSSATLESEESSTRVDGCGERGGSEMAI